MYTKKLKPLPSLRFCGEKQKTYWKHTAERLHICFKKNKMQGGANYEGQV
jgi:hypothetical protein